MATFDAVFVGSGINSLVGAALLARDGWSVCVLERNDVAGGCIRTSTDLTLPGFTHEVLASWHPLFTGSAAYAELKDELDRRGVTYVNTDLPTGAAFPDGSAAFITGSLEGNVAEFDRLAPGDGAAWERQFNAFMAQRRPRRSGSSRPSSGRRPASRSAARRSAGSVAAGCSSSPATRSSAAATGSPRRSSPRRPTASSRPGCSTRASARIRRRRGS